MRLTSYCLNINTNSLNNNGKIIFTVLVSFVIAFSIFYTTIYFLENSTSSNITSEELDFYSNISTEKKIFLIGSSEMLTLNATFITEKISDKLPDHVVYNLGKPADLPKVRINSIDHIIESKPKIVLYGIGFRDIEKIPEGGFGGLVIKDNLGMKKEIVDPKTEFEKILYNIGFYKMDLAFLENPKFQILTKVKKIFEEKEEGQSLEEQFPNTPFYKMETSDIEKKINQTPIDQIGVCSALKNFEIEELHKDRNLVSLEIMIEKLKEKNIQVILFSTPLHKNCFLDKKSISANELFETAVMKLAQKHDIEFYPLHKSYWDYEMWLETDHLTYQNSFLFSDDIAKIIEKGI